jgi:hypothetical protein
MKPIKKVVSEPVTACGESELQIDVQDTGATTIVTVTRGNLTPQAKAKLARRYPGAIIIG